MRNNVRYLLMWVRAVSARLPLVKLISDRRLLLAVSVICCIILIHVGQMNGDTLKGFAPRVNRKQLPQYSDLLSVDISKELKGQNLTRNGFDASLTEKHFSKKNVEGYMSLPLDFVDDSSLFSKYVNVLDYYIWDYNIDVDVLKVREAVLDRQSPLGTLLKQSDEKDWDDEKIQKRWFAFGTVAVWLEREQVYLVYTRTFYSKQSIRNAPYISLIYGQAFDRNWKELQDFRVPYEDVDVPAEVEEKLVELQDKIEMNSCDDKINEEKSVYDTCMKSAQKKNSKIEERIDKILDKYSVRYPSVMEIPFVIHDNWNGPEDPRIVLKKTRGHEEPVIVFNMESRVNRKFYAFQPHRKFNPMVQFDIENHDLRSVEKNWSAFFHEEDVSESNPDSPGSIHFVYSFEPLEILKCSLFDGMCNVTYKGTETGGERANKKFTAIRGGTQFVSLPAVLPGVANRNIWVAMAKTNVENCGCGSRFYRAALAVMVETAGEYKIDMIAPNVDFGTEPLSWDLKSHLCGGLNVLSPNGITSWEIVSQDPQTKSFDDYMTLTFSEADAVSRFVTVRGVLNYVLGIYAKDRNNHQGDASTSNTTVLLEQMFKDVAESALRFCSIYGLGHKEPKR
ncbi:uncharacterized protein KNAG_0E03160 [Huiozyma naganishii CBS 8797]|uniref:Uncharacterized protein n=1 Tax=Huiozyma naganishii (strain ATCC MYA-139 / BCRC 22969 / CBS 8797 / KCTC 17520 / NBRC 10181 / NCYC 3082 / Yp74L-3) TaxID=1071383 RepID=J7R6U7_HUIN7|nr:hypothetical protein KNAG_0E03160 [Kazachstania naganishii CBS 8797]CCK70575.1 hypothetical protein KNAG_0E03160 [Kazachstania naganishii CBS 8797]